MKPEDEAGRPTSAIEEISVKDIQEALERLEGQDRIGTAGEVAATAGGVVAGVSAAGAVAGAAGASTLLGSTTLAGVLGGVFVTTTPVGWVVACAVAGGLAAYGISRLVRSGGQQDQVRVAMKQRLSRRLSKARSAVTSEGAPERFARELQLAHDRGLVDASQADRMRGLVERGVLEPAIALERLELLARSAKAKP